MPVVISGTNGVSGVDGTASNPSYEGTDSNTGIFFPAADTIAFAEGGTEVARFDSSGNFGIGTLSPAYRLDVTGGTGSFGGSSGVGAIRVAGAGGVWFWIDNPTTTTMRLSSGATPGTGAMVLDSSGNVGIGTSSPTAKVGVISDGAPSASGNMATGLYVAAGAGSYAINIGANSTGQYSWINSAFQNNSGVAAPLVFATGATERARMTSGGYFKASNTGTYANITGSYHEFVTNANELVLSIVNSSATTSAQVGGIGFSYTGAAPNSAVFEFLRGQDTAATRFTMRSNGGLVNYQANNVNLSDRREKTNFAPAGEYLSKICAIPVQTFNYIDQSEDDPGLTLGVVAQDVQAVAPELVTESDWGTEEEPKMRLSIYQTDLQYALMKCIQEQQQMIEELKAKVAALEAK